jgi:hypothetical protein
MASELPPTYYFTDISFNPSFYSSGSDNITLEEAQSLILSNTNSGTDTITTLTTATINTLGSTLSIGTNGTTSDTVIIGTNTNTQTSIYGGIIGLLSNTTILGNLTSNSYNLSGTTPTLTKASLGYYVNYAIVSASYAASNKYLYSPASNTAVTESHYLQTGVYIANIHMYAVAAAGQTYSNTFQIGVSSGTNIQSMPVNSQYGTMVLTSGDLVSINNGTNLAGNYSSFAYSGCFILTTSSFVNLEFYLKTQSGATQTYNLYGCIHRIA